METTDWPGGGGRGRGVWSPSESCSSSSAGRESSPAVDMSYELSSASLMTEGERGSYVYTVQLDLRMDISIGDFLSELFKWAEVV